MFIFRSPLALIKPLVNIQEEVQCSLEEFRSWRWRQVTRSIPESNYTLLMQVMSLNLMTHTEWTPYWQTLTILGKWSTWCTIMLYNTFIVIILYMFWATLCSSSGGQIVLIVLIQFDLLMTSTVLLETCREL